MKLHKIILSVMFLAIISEAKAVDSAVLISDSIFSGTNAITEPTKMGGYLLTQKSGIYIHDMSRAGAMICRYDGFPNNMLPTGINDLRVSVSNVLSKYVIVMRGVNDYDAGKTSIEIRAELKSFIMFVKQQNRIPIIISPLMTSEELINRPGLQSVRNDIQFVSTNAGAIFIDGTTLLDSSNPDYWADGVHPSELGTDVMTTNLANKLIPINN